MPHHLLPNGLSPSQIEMKEMGLGPARWPVGRTFLLSLALADIAATALTLLSQ